MFLVFAACLWWMYALKSVRERTIVVPIQYTGIPQNVDFSNPLPTAANITICDAGNRLRYYSQHHITSININLSEQLRGKSGDISITSESFRSQINDHLQGTSKLLKISPDLFETHYFVQASKTVPVVFQGDVNAANQYQITQEILLTPSKVTLYGDKAVLDTIQSISTSAMNLNGVKDSMRTDIDIVLPNFIRSNTKSVSALIIAEQYTEKVFTKTIQPRGVPAGESMKLFPATAQITIRVSLSHFNDVTDRDVRVWARYPKSTEQAKVDVESTCNNPYISGIRVTPTAAEYLIEK